MALSSSGSIGWRPQHHKWGLRVLLGGNLNEDRHIEHGSGSQQSTDLLPPDPRARGSACHRESARPGVCLGVRRSGRCRDLHAPLGWPNPGSDQALSAGILGRWPESIAELGQTVLPRACDVGEGRPHGREPRDGGRQASGKEGSLPNGGRRH